MISKIKISIDKMEKGKFNTKSPFSVLKDQTDTISRNIRDMEDITRRQNMQRTGFPGG